MPLAWHHKLIAHNHVTTLYHNRHKAASLALLQGSAAGHQWKVAGMRFPPPFGLRNNPCRLMHATRLRYTRIRSMSPVSYVSHVIEQEGHHPAIR